MPRACAPEMTSLGNGVAGEGVERDLGLVGRPLDERGSSAGLEVGRQRIGQLERAADERHGGTRGSPRVLGRIGELGQEGLHRRVSADDAKGRRLADGQRAELGPFGRREQGDEAAVGMADEVVARLEQFADLFVPAPRSRSARAEGLADTPDGRRSRACSAPRAAAARPTSSFRFRRCRGRARLAGRTRWSRHAPRQAYKLARFRPSHAALGCYKVCYARRGWSPRAPRRFSLQARVPS